MSNAEIEQIERRLFRINANTYYWWEVPYPTADSCVLLYDRFLELIATNELQDTDFRLIVDLGDVRKIPDSPTRKGIRKFFEVPGLDHVVVCTGKNRWTTAIAKLLVNLAFRGRHFDVTPNIEQTLQRLELVDDRRAQLRIKAVKRDAASSAST